MKHDSEPAPDWLDEVWRVKDELSAEANRMGLLEYLAFAEREADRILGSRPEPCCVHDKPADPKGRKP
jgi:hypothetical protein